MFGIMLLDIATIILTALMWLIIIQAVLSWLVAFNVIKRGSGGMMTFVMALDRLMSPIYRPIRRIMPDFGGLDLSPLVVIILIQILVGPVFNYLRLLLAGGY